MTEHCTPDGANRRFAHERADAEEPAWDLLIVIAWTVLAIIEALWLVGALK